MTRCRPLSLTIRCCLLSAFLVLTAHCSLLTVHAQSATATLSGTVTDPNNAVVPGARVTVTNNATGLKRQATTGGSGTFTIPLLPPSTYTMLVENQGFTPAEIKDVVLNVNDNVSLNVELKVGQVGATVDVKSEAPLINESPAVGTVVDRQFVANLPLNGRSFQSLITLTPGVVTTKSSLTEQGQFSVNGQRADANYFTVDGVGANIAISASGQVGQSFGGSLPGFSASGGTNNLVSVDALQEFKIQTSTYAPEFGRSPGGQVSIVTRSGTNRFSGNLFEYFRNDVLDANDWFANANRLPKAALRQNDFGVVIGGPVLLPRFGEGDPVFGYNGRNRTFFFFSYEGLRLRQPLFGITDVPSRAARQAAPAGIKPLLNAYPLPTGPDRTNGFAEFVASYSDASTLNATSIRVDHVVNNKLTLFFRYNYAPSESIQRGVNLSPLNDLDFTQIKTQTITAGATVSLTTNVSNELRLNYSRNRGANFFQLDSLGGAVPPADSSLFPAPHSPADAQLFFFIQGGANTILTVGPSADNVQRQINVVDNLSVVRKAHQLKFGIDYRRLSPFLGIRNYGQTILFTGVTGANGIPSPGTALSGIALLAVANAADSNTLVFNSFSAYAQDTWKSTRRLTFTYGLRWELNPPPYGEKDLITVQGLDNPATLTLAPLGTPLYKTTYGNFAPRAGVAYQLSQRRGRETVLRGGFGIFYDLGTGFLGNAAANPPYLRARQTFFAPYPLSSVTATPPPFNLNGPFTTDFFVADPNLKLPRTYQWTLAAEQSLGANQVLSATYVGAAGRRLLRLESIKNPNPTFAAVDVTTNAATSDYHAMQLQFQRRLSRGLQILASYTWSKSLDNVSNDSALLTPGATLDPQQDRGPSDFDIRHSFSAAVTYNIPAPAAGTLGTAVLRGWAIDSIFIAHSATPVDVFVSRNLGFGSFSFRPDLISGVPLYVDDPTAAGGRRFNSNAFVIPATLRQGTLGRNALRGFPVYQANFALRRQFTLTERVGVQFRVEFFNIFNHPNFGDPSGNLGVASTFGRSTSMLNRSLGSGGIFGGFSPIYQVGGPRSIQFALKLGF